MLKFYNREKEIEQLYKIEQLTEHTAQMTFVIGRRRIGKLFCLKRLLVKRVCFIFLWKKRMKHYCVKNL